MALLPRYDAAAAASEAKAAAAKQEMEQNNFEALIPEIKEHIYEAPIPEKRYIFDDRRQ